MNGSLNFKKKNTHKALFCIRYTFLNLVLKPDIFPQYNLGEHSHGYEDNNVSNEHEDGLEGEDFSNFPEIPGFIQS